MIYLGQLDEAEQHARHAVELDPLSSLARGNLARILFYAGKLDEADAAARKAAELQPTGCLQVIGGRVVVAVQRGDGETALRKRNLSPTKVIAVSSSRSLIMRAVIARRQTRL